MRIGFAIFLIMHGIAHIVGFVVPWRIGNVNDPPYRTTLLNGAIDVGDMGIRIAGIIWLLTALVFMLAGAGVFTFAEWWKNLTIYLTVFSLLICFLGLPDSKIGIFINILILLFLFIGEKYNWLTVAEIE